MACGGMRTRSAVTLTLQLSGWRLLLLLPPRVRRAQARAVCMAGDSRTGECCAIARKRRGCGGRRRPKVRSSRHFGAWDLKRNEVYFLAWLGFITRLKGRHSTIATDSRVQKRLHRGCHPATHATPRGTHEAPPPTTTQVPAMDNRLDLLKFGMSFTFLVSLRDSRICSDRRELGSTR